MKTKYYILHFFIILSCVGALAQNTDATRLLLQSKKYYESQPSINLLIDYKLYDDSKGGHLIDEVKGQYIKLHNGSYSRYGYMHTFSTTHLYWVIDDQSKVIYVKDIIKEQKTPIETSSPSLNPDKVGDYLKFYKTIKVSLLENEEYKIVISNPSGSYHPFRSVTIWLNKTGALSKLELVYPTTLREMGIEDSDNIPRMVVSYQTSTTTPPSDILDSNKYFTISNSQRKGIGKYQKHMIKNF